MYIRSSIIKRKDTLWDVKIVTSDYYFWEKERHATFLTMSECQEWLLSNRCSELVIESPESNEDKQIKQLERACETTALKVTRRTYDESD